MFRLEILFFTQIVIGILLMVLLHKMSKIKNQVDDIVSEVKGYIAFITEDTAEEAVSDIPKMEQNFYEEQKISQNIQRKASRKESREDAQTQLIQAVLGEYFP